MLESLRDELQHEKSLFSIFATLPGLSHIRVNQDGTMASTENGKAIKTMTAAESISAKATWGSAARRKLSLSSMDYIEDAGYYDEYDLFYDGEDIEGLPHACFTLDEVTKLYDNVKEGSGTTLTLVDENDPSVERTMFIGGKAERRLMNGDSSSRRKLSGEEDAELKYVFEDAKVSFQYAPDKCGERRRLNGAEQDDGANYVMSEDDSAYERGWNTGFEDVEYEEADLDKMRSTAGHRGKFMVPPIYYLKNGECTRFYTNPQDFDESERRDKYVRQVRPCGHYDRIFSDASCQYETTYQIIEPNVDYPFRGSEGDLLDNLYLVRFDVGSQLNTQEFDSGCPTINFNAINFDESEPLASVDIIMAEKIEGETCIETFTFGGENFGFYGGSSYNCMGVCGGGCQTPIFGKDCMKHDMCSYYKSLIQGFPAAGYGSDTDCGDEGAQAVINCYQKKFLVLKKPVICGPQDNIHAELHPISLLPNQNYNYRVTSTLRSGLDKGQGIRRPWNHNRIMAGKSIAEWRDQEWAGCE